MALQWTSAIRDIVCYTAIGKAYSALRTDEAAILDASNSPTVPTDTPGGVAGQAMTIVNQYAQWFSEAGAVATAAPSVWDHVLTYEAAFRLCQSMRQSPQTLKAMAGQRDTAWMQAMDAYTKDDASGSTFTAGAVTSKVIRFHVIRHCLRRARIRNRLCPQVADIDNAIIWVINTLWNSMGLEYRKRNVVMTIPTANSGSSPTFDLTTPEAFDKVASNYFAYAADSAVGTYDVDRIRYVNSTELAEWKAANATNAETGKPAVFHVENRGGTTRYWHFVPAPDVEYTAYGSVFLRTPVAPTNSTDTTPFDRFPATFAPMFLNLTLAKILKDYALEGWEAAWTLATKEMESLAPNYDSTGEPADFEVQSADVYGDYSRSMGGTGL